MTQKKLIVSVYVFVCCVVTAMGQSLKYYNADDFPLIGKMFDDTEGRYARLPLSCKGESKKWVWILGQDTPGLAVRFATNSTAIAAKWVTMKGEMNEYMLYLPLYDGIETLEIGIEEKAMIRQPQVESPVTERPVICYGTSITQGGCATRPGMAYTNILSRMLNREVVNLGFSGHGHLEYEIAELMTHRNPSVIVMDFIPNVSASMLNERIERFMSIIEDKIPGVQILFIEHVPFPLAEFNLKKGEWVEESNEALRKAFRELKKKGYQNLHYLKSEHLLGEDGESTVDGEHFTDLGFDRFAKGIYPVVKKLIRHAER